MRALSASPPRMANDRPVSMKTKEYRKIVKPLLERRRRARINSCLNELRNFILDATKQDSVQASKLEKADILEMTVHYLRLLLRQQCAAATAASSRTDTAIDVGRFRAGFTECANEVSMFVAANMSNSAVNPQVRSCLLGHLSKCMSHLDRISSTEASSMQLLPPPTSSEAMAKRLPPLPSGPAAPAPPPPPPYGPRQPEVFGRISSGRPPPLYPFNCTAINNNTNTNNFTAKTWSSSDDEEDGDLAPKTTGSPWPPPPTTTPLIIQEELHNNQSPASMPVPTMSSSSSFHQGHYATKAQLKSGPYQQLAAAAAHHQGYHSLSPSNSTILVTVMQPSAATSSSSSSSAMAVADGSDALDSPVWRPW